MQQFQLGDYRGGRESITPLMNAEIPELRNVNDTARTFGSIGLQAMANRHLTDQKANLGLRNSLAMQAQTLHDNMGLAALNAQYASQKANEDYARKQEEEDQIMQGQEAAMEDWSNNVLNLYEPGSPEHKQALKTLQMIQDRRRGGTAFNKGYMSLIADRNIWDPISQGTAGAAGFQQAKKPVPAGNKKPLPKKAPSGFGDDHLTT